MTTPTVNLVGCAPHWQEELVDMWRESFQFGVGIEDPHTIAEQIEYFRTEVVPNNSVQLALSGARLVGFVAASAESVAQLYVRVGWHRQGIGSRLLAWAKAQSHGSLWLYTFERNQVAQAFYQRHGFQVVARGFEPSWQLPDVKYHWSNADHTNAGRPLLHPT